MEDKLQNAEPAAEAKPDPMATAIAGGYKEPEPLSTEQRAKNLVASLEHAVKHNAPVAREWIKEARDLLGVADEVVEKVEGAEAAAEKAQGDQAPK